jgi:hypothetical protein
VATGVARSTMSTSIRLRESDLAWREIEGQIVAIDLSSSTYLAVNRSGTVLWPMLVAGTTKDALASALVQAFTLDDEAARRDVEAFLGELRDRRLLCQERS